MKGRRSQIAALGAVLLGVCLFVSSNYKKPDRGLAAHRPRGPELSNAAVTIDPVSKRIGQLYRENPAPKDRRLLRTDMRFDKDLFDRFIDGHSGSAESLALAFLLTNDSGYLQRLKTWSKSRVAITVLAQQSRNPAERLFWAEKLDRENPGNGIGQLLMSAALARTGDPDGALIALNKAHGAPEMKSAMSDLKPLLLDLAAEMPEDEKVNLLFDKLDTSRTMVMSNLLPEDRGALFDGRTGEEGTAIAKAYFDILEKCNSQNGFEILAISGFDEMDRLRTSLRFGILSGLYKACGESAALSLDAVPLKARALEIINLTAASIGKRNALSPAEIDALVNEALSNSLKQQK